MHDSLQGTAGSGDQLGVRAGGSAHHALSALRILHATDQETVCVFAAVGCRRAADSLSAMI